MNPNVPLPKGVIKVQGGRLYRNVNSRIEAFRADHPLGSIITEIVEINHADHYALFRATILTAEGAILATGTKKEDAKGFGDYIEKAEKGAIGRALVSAGYTSDGDDDEVSPTPPPRAPQPPARPVPPSRSSRPATVEERDFLDS